MQSLKPIKEPQGSTCSADTITACHARSLKHGNNKNVIQESTCEEQLMLQNLSEVTITQKLH
jgi:hypothetical protein